MSSSSTFHETVTILKNLVIIFVSTSSSSHHTSPDHIYLLYNLLKLTIFKGLYPTTTLVTCLQPNPIISPYDHHPYNSLANSIRDGI